MSDQTPNSSEDLSGAEPSMEDILASIRKIISEDEPIAMESPEDVQIAPIADISEDLTSDAILDATNVDIVSSDQEVGSVDLDIDEVLAGIEDLDAPSVPEEISPATEFATADLGSPAVDPVDDDILSMLDMDIDLEPETLTEPSRVAAPVSDDIVSELDIDALLNEPTLTDADELVAEAAVLDDMSAMEGEFSSSAIEADDDLAMDALLEDILATPNDSTPSESVTDTESFDLEDAELEAAPDTAQTSSVAQDPDLDLVKSLMADLADNPESASSDEDLDALLSIPELEEPESEEPESEDLGLVADSELDASDLGDFDIDEVLGTSEEPELSESEVSASDIPVDLSDASTEEEDILGDILNMTLEDELQAQPDDIVPTADDILADEQANAAENDEFDLLDDLISDESNDAVEIDSGESLPSLSDIAAAAEADAVEAEHASISTAGAAAGVAGLAALGAAVATRDAPETDTEVVAETAADIDTQPETQTQQQPQQIVPQETPMPVKAVKTDAILDDITETAAAGAFAELNQVVEDKAVFNERGPRIGDLVQDALRPMLKEWLDANLKGIVERAVTKEVKRISSGK